MLTLYIACLVFGGALMLVSLFSGGDSAIESIDTAGDLPDADVHALDTHDISTDHDLSDAGHVAGHEGDVSHTVSAEAVKFLSFRNAVFFTGFFGLTGTVLTLSDIPSFLTLITSVGIGFLSAQTGYRFLRYLKKTESGEALHLNQLSGHTARVLVGCSREHPGKIGLNAGGRSHQLVARVSEDAERDTFSEGETVIISQVIDGTAWVIEGDLLQ